MTNYKTSLEQVYRLRDANPATAPQTDNKFSAFIRSQFTFTHEGLVLNSVILAVIAVLAVLLVMVNSTAAAHSSVEAPAVWTSEDGQYVLSEGDVVIGSANGQEG